MKILVSGGAGYIGSHFVKFISKLGYDVVIMDDLSRGHREAIYPDAEFEKVNLLDFDSIQRALAKYEIDAVVHFAAFAYVGESVENPGLYYTNNVAGSLNLIKAVKEAGISRFVFSSTCSIYGDDAKIPISEKSPANPINPYAQTKLMIENILSDFDSSHGLKYTALRYFNAAGDDPDGLIGESHNPEPHLIPLILKTALGEREKIYVFGNDYPTPDGTAIRDYIHVNDLANAHLKALEYLSEGGDSTVINLGTGKGNSVLEVIKTAEEVTGQKINFEIVERREGDPAELVADNSKAKNVLGWVPKYNLNDILLTAWNWHKNPKY